MAENYKWQGSNKRKQGRAGLGQGRAGQGMNILKEGRAGQGMNVLKEGRAGQIRQNWRQGRARQDRAGRGRSNQRQGRTNQRLHVASLHFHGRHYSARAGYLVAHSAEAHINVSFVQHQHDVVTSWFNQCLQLFWAIH